MSLDVWEYHEEQMCTNPKYKVAYEALEPEFSIASALIKARSEADMTQVDVAGKMGVTQSTIARIESGKNVSIKTIRRYAKAVGKSITLEIQPV